MKHNIIAIFVFIGFIATVFTLGYVTSRDTMPMYRGHIPDINTSGSQSVSRSAANDGLAIPSLSAPQQGRVNSGYRSLSEQSFQTGSSQSLGGGISTSSSQTLHSYGGGSSSDGSSSNGNSNISSLASGFSGGGMMSLPSLAFDSRERTKTISGNTPLGMQPYDVNAPRFGSFDDEDPEPGDRPGPYQDPVGNVPITLFMIMVGAYIAIKTLRLKHD